MELSGESPIVIPHPLNELPVKVDVQVKVIHGGMEYIFPGLGSAQRDDDIATDYGGVGYIYNELDVKIYVPVAQNNGNGQGWVITTASPYVNVAHNLGVYPDFVTVQLILSSGYVSEAQGTTPVTFNHGDKWINTCGTVFGITDSHVTLWGASEADDFIACFKDGWGSEDISYTSATVEIRAWILTLTETKDNTVPSGRMFYGAGTASQGDAGESFGGTLYGYNSSHVLLWTPALSYGYPIYVGGVWAGGTDSLQSSSVDVSVKVIATGTVPQVGCSSPPSISNGYYVVTNDSAVYHCNQEMLCPTPTEIPNAIEISNGTQNGSVTLYSCLTGYWGNSDISCSDPPEIQNAMKLSDGLENGSSTLYTCMPGFTSNNGQPKISCSEIKPCDVPPSIPNAYYTLDNTTATYHCYHGYTGNQTDSTIRCVNSQWEATTLNCSNITCGPPSDIPNTVKVSDGFYNGSMTIYSCLPGFSSNNEYPNTTCNGSHWSSVQFACSGILMKLTY
ncbi:sushi, von Willebrand factor type A, EGF and pentraxin domain-containing protein 1-like [Saccostrea echinata]|uniref:sushi, von Willebrand factor type A, EGF and pentraxin domain-containing protein 1-like n=1 Tax=Saccostrea echinata TaxID=191078 RepID=UPI002A81A385|nr:sushi, von Willebrand factor type A, EGF and pentraxin domain-containing protein 1-like [Saccostrea echinata]